MPTTTAGVAIGAATGGALGGAIAGADYGVMLGAIIGASVSVIASKDNNKRKIMHFFMALSLGLVLAFPASDLMRDVWNINVNPRFPAVILAAIAIPFLIYVATPENLQKLVSWFGSFLKGRFGGGNQ